MFLIRESGRTCGCKAMGLFFMRPYAASLLYLLSFFYKMIIRYTSFN